MKTVLFLCVYNASRSIMAEAILNQIGKDRFRAFSAGERAIGAVHPLTLQTLADNGIPVAGLRSKSWAHFFGLGAPKLDYLITVCDETLEEMGGHDPTAPVEARWPTANPLLGGRTEAEHREALARTYRLLRARVEALVVLPLESMDRGTTRKELAAIGQRLTLESF
jgi:protein-tyrosine-phosphatase